MHLATLYLHFHRVGIVLSLGKFFIGLATYYIPKFGLLNQFAFLNFFVDVATLYFNFDNLQKFYICVRKFLLDLTTENRKSSFRIWQNCILKQTPLKLKTMFFVSCQIQIFGIYLQVGRIYEEVISDAFGNAVLRFNRV